MRWSTIGGLFSLKALVLACVLAPVPAATVPTAAHAQFGIVLPFPGIQFRGPGRYYGRGYRGRRYSKRSRSSGEGKVAAGAPGEATPARASGGKVRGTVD